jgi:hypothetical protein
MYGTPWHGEAKYGLPRAVRLERIFFLRHGANHSIKQASRIEAVSKFLTCSFPPYWDPQAMEFSMELFADLTAHIPCEQLTFMPEISVVEFIEKTINQSPSGNNVCG